MVATTATKVTTNKVTSATTAASSLPSNYIIPIIPDTAANGHYFMMTAGLPAHAIPCANAIKVHMPNGSFIKTTHTSLLALPGLPANACLCHIFTELSSGSLLSIGKLCDYGCTAHFDGTAVIIELNGVILLRGTCDTTNGLWQINLPVSSSSSLAIINSIACSTVTPVTKTVADQVAFYHATMFSPAISTWCKAINAGHLTTWPVLTSAQVHKHLPTSAAKIRGHLDQ